MNRYLLPCSCTHRIVVGPGQAGGTVTCPECGAEQAVPRLGALARLDLAGAERPDDAGRTWSGAQAWIVAGLAVAVIGLAAAGWLRIRRGDIAALDERQIRAAVEAAPTHAVHAAWLTFERQGISRQAFSEERRRQQQATALGGLEMAAWITAALGAAVACAAFLSAGPSGRGGAARS